MGLCRIPIGPGFMNLTQIWLNYCWLQLLLRSSAASSAQLCTRFKPSSALAVSVPSLIHDLGNREFPAVPSLSVPRMFERRFQQITIILFFFSPSIRSWSDSRLKSRSIPPPQAQLNPVYQHVNLTGGSLTRSFSACRTKQKG